MSKIIITQRDVQFFEYLHACKVATTKQINRDIFKSSHATCYQRIKKYLDRKFLKVVPTDRSLDQSFAFEVTTKGEKIIKANLRDLISGDRFRSNSVTHDLNLVDIRNILMRKKVVKEYYTDNQIQTYKNFRTEKHLVPAQELQLDAMLKLHKGDLNPIWVGLEFESSAKAISRYQEKIRRFYYSGPPFLLYICEDRSIENKVKKVESIYIKDKTPKIFYLTLRELLESKESVTFTRQDGQSLCLE